VENGKDTAHQRLIFSIQKPVEVLIETKNYPFLSKYLNSIYHLTQSLYRARTSQDPLNWAKKKLPFYHYIPIKTASLILAGRTPKEVQGIESKFVRPRGMKQHFLTYHNEVIVLQQLLRVDDTAFGIILYIVNILDDYIKDRRVE
jgi:hypothetical protein